MGLRVSCYLSANHFMFLPACSLIFSIFNIWKTGICPIYLIGVKNCEEKLMWILLKKQKWTTIHMWQGHVYFSRGTWQSLDINKVHFFQFLGWLKIHNSGNVQILLREILCVWLALEMEKAMATHSSTLAWKIPWMEEPHGLQSMGSLGVGHDWVTSLSLFTFMH